MTNAAHNNSLHTVLQKNAIHIRTNIYTIQFSAYTHIMLRKKFFLIIGAYYCQLTVA